MAITSKMGRLNSAKPRIQSHFRAEVLERLAKSLGKPRPMSSAWSLAARCYICARQCQAWIRWSLVHCFSRKNKSPTAVEFVAWLLPTEPR